MAIIVEGSVQRPVELDFSDLAALPGQVGDVGVAVPGREGTGVLLRSIIDVVGVESDATYLTVVATDGDFAASVPLDAVSRAIVVYRLGDEPLPPSHGGPIRFLIPDAASCRTAEVDTCANVKYVGRLRFSTGPGLDTRPRTRRAHRELHEAKGARSKDER